MRVLSCLLIPLLAASALGQGGPPALDLKAGNEAARSVYKAARERAWSEAGPIVLWDGDDLVFRVGSYRRVSQPIPPLYHDLKISGHMALGIHALLAHRGDAALGPVPLFELSRFRETVRKVHNALKERGLSKEQMQRQDKMLDACEAYLGKVIEARKGSSGDLRELLRSFRPILAENNRDAARAQIDGMHREMQQFRAQLGEAEWGKLRVIVQGSQMPRKDNLAVQYFARLLNEPGEGSRILYAEMLFDENRALALLGTRLLDTQLGDDVWEDPQRMHRDLLGDAARVYLDELFARK
jgi:hypothetical protein